MRRALRAWGTQQARAEIGRQQGLVREIVRAALFDGGRADFRVRAAGRQQIRKVARGNGIKRQLPVRWVRFAVPQIGIMQAQKIEPCVVRPASLVYPVMAHQKRQFQEFSSQEIAG